MQIQWCLKGIAERSPGPTGGPKFGDAEAMALLSTGILSSAVHQDASNTLIPAISDAHHKLSDVALDDHVNNFPSVGHKTPYISLSAGVVLPAPVGGVSVLPAWQTAAAFATRYGKSIGYIFRCWTVVSPKGAPEIAGVSDAVRDLNIFRKFWIFQDEGEIAAKLIVPARQIECVHKIDRFLKPARFVGDRRTRVGNPDFVRPDRLSNLLEAIR